MAKIAAIVVAGTCWAPSGIAAVAPRDLAWLRGSGGEPAPRDRGDSGNALLLRGRHGAVVVDPGASGARAARIAARARAWGMPVVAAIVTHPHAEVTLAAGALPVGVRVWAAEPVAAQMRSRCERCLARMQEMVGADALGSAGIRLPTRIVGTDGAGEGEVAIAGRRFAWRLLGRAHGDADTAWLDLASGTLAVGGTVAGGGTLPEVSAEGGALAWPAALARLEAWPGVRRIVPLHGAPGGPELLRRTRDYLEAVIAAVRADVATGGDAADVSVRLAATGWLEAGLALPTPRTDEVLLRRHALNLQRAWREAEAELFGSGR